MKMSKKMVAGVLLSGMVLMMAVPAYASSLPSVKNTEGSIVLEENDDPTEPKDPTDPKEPIEPEDPDNPGTGNAGPLSLDVAPRAFDFGTQKMYQDTHTYTGVVTTDPQKRNQQYVQVTDNREAVDGGSDRGWNVTVKQDHDLISAGGHELTGARIKLPQAAARNSLNVDSSAVDSSYTVVGATGVEITNAALTIFAPDTTTFSKGKGTSTMLWKASEVALTIPAGVAKTGDYTNNVEWSLTAGPTI
ncbi:WxL domain-containing protein [Enterococcus sp. LJL90]